MKILKLNDAGEIETYPVNVAAEFRRTSFPGTIVQSALPPGYYLVTEIDQPRVRWDQEAVEIQPELVNGEWRQRFTVQDKAAPDKVEVLTAQWKTVRLQRDALLLATDWTQLADTVLTAEQVTAWRDYRAALRAITEQADPFSITWPVAPDRALISYIGSIFQAILRSAAR